jgi:hypothetical protein
MSETLTHDRLLHLVRYEELTGLFWSRFGRSGVPGSRPLGHVEKNGYRRLRVDGYRVLAHRLAWFYVTGSWPDKDVDHKNLQRDDNAWENLRLATDSQNHANTMGGRGRSGLKGAHWNGARGYWQSYIKVEGRNYFLGRFTDPEAAHAAYSAAAIRHFGQFARVA